MSRSGLVILAVAFGCSPAIAVADSPMAIPERQTFWSPSRAYYAISDSLEGATSVYRVNGKGGGDRLWSMCGRFLNLWVADDGLHVVVGNELGNMVSMEPRKDQILAYFIRRGELIKTARLGELIERPDALRKTASHRLWGDYPGFDKNGRFLIATEEGRTFAFDVSTGLPSEIPRKPH